MSLEELGMALGGAQAGMDQAFRNRQEMEDADAARKKRDLALAMDERDLKFREATDEFRANSMKGAAQVALSQGKKAEATVDGAIDAVNASNEATVASSELDIQTNEARLAQDAGTDIANTEAIDRERQRDEDEYKQRVIAAEVAAGVPEQEARTKADNAWTKRKLNEERRESAQEIMDAIRTDRLNGVQANEAIARKQQAIAARRTSEIQAGLTKMRQESGIDDAVFQQKYGEQIMDNTHDALYMTEAGLGAEAVDLLNFDRDGNGVGDLRELGVTRMEVSEVNGNKVMGAVGEDGMPVVDPDTGEPVIFKADDLYNWADNRARGGKQAVPAEIQAAYEKGAKFGSKTGKAPKPLTVSDVNRIDDTLDEIISKGWGLDPDNDGEYNMENIVSTEALDDEVFLTHQVVGENGAVTTKKTPLGGSGEVVYARALDQFEVDTRRFLATQHGATGSVMEGMADLRTMPTAVKAVYPMIPDHLIDAAMRRGTDNAEREAMRAGIKKEGTAERIFNYFTEGSDYEAQPQAVKQAQQAELLKLMSLTQKRLANEG